MPKTKELANGFHSYSEIKNLESSRTPGLIADIKVMSQRDATMYRGELDRCQDDKGNRDRLEEYEVEKRYFIMNIENLRGYSHNGKPCSDVSVFFDFGGVAKDEYSAFIFNIASEDLKKNWIKPSESSKNQEETSPTTKKS